MNDAPTPLRTALAAELALPPDHPAVSLAVRLVRKLVPTVRRRATPQYWIVRIGADGACELYAMEPPIEAERPTG